MSQMTAKKELRLMYYFRVISVKTGKVFKSIFWYWIDIPKKYKFDQKYIVQAFDGKEWYEVK